MDAKAASNLILKKLLKDFDKYKDLPNQQYLEEQLRTLYRMSGIYKVQSINSESSARQRARARDLEQNTLGLINGIKFGISFWLHENQDLAALAEQSINTDGPGPGGTH